MGSPTRLGNFASHRLFGNSSAALRIPQLGRSIPLVVDTSNAAFGADNFTRTGDEGLSVSWSHVLNDCCALSTPWDQCLR
jgi:hypothetical protein